MTTLTTALRSLHLDRTSLPRSAPLADPGRLARHLAARRDLWARHVRFDPSSPYRVGVYSDDAWEVELGAWLPGQGTRTHEHVGRRGALLVLQGVLTETTWLVATDGPEPGRRHAVTRTYGADELRSHGDVHVHAVSNAGSDPALALHVRATGG
jgi:predicted metal-dependent enzyme (double-stranded beta helix superfamily)